MVSELKPIETKVAGVTFYDTDFKSISTLSKVEIIPEPNNEYDKNALKVIVDGNQIGYIKKEINHLLLEKVNNNSINARISNVIGGGEYDNYGVILSISFDSDEEKEHTYTKDTHLEPRNIDATTHYGSNIAGTGVERAVEHINQARQLSTELGGTDRDVKAYFFSLPRSELKPILDEYEFHYGEKARDYAESTLHKWSSGTVHMSGMVAERLFKLLPPRMPLETKYELTTSLWKSVGPSSKKTYYVSPNAEINVVIDTVKSHLEQVVVEYKIPDEMERRFNWLSQGDVEIKQKLLNHIREQEKKLLTDTLKNQLDILKSHLQSENGELTHHVAQTLQVGKHEVKIIMDQEVEGITENRPVPSRPVSTDSESELGWLWWVIGGLILLWLFGR